VVAVVLRGGVLEVVEVVFIGKSRLADVSLSLFSIGFVVTDDGEAFDVELALAALHSDLRSSPDIFLFFLAVWRLKFKLLLLVT